MRCLYGDGGGNRGTINKEFMAEVEIPRVHIFMKN